ncbi:MAG: hypothetical protein ABFE07_00795 [Armatimonadia bacterium]
MSVVPKFSKRELRITLYCDSSTRQQRKPNSHPISNAMEGRAGEDQIQLRARAKAAGWTVVEKGQGGDICPTCHHR